MDAAPRFTALQGRRVHLGVCGSVAAYKAVELMRMLQKAELRVSVTLTEAAARFVTPLTFASLDAETVYTGMFEAGTADPFAHLAPGAEADAFVVAPATAATLARLARGLADDMLSAQALAFPGPLVLAPAMNPRMWSNPATRENMALLEGRGHRVVGPAGGRVACGDQGQGKLAPLEDIAAAVLAALAPDDMAGVSLLVTLGPTREQWDGVRFWTNPSTGRMGAALALAAWLRGAAVTAVAGPGCPWLPCGVRRIDVISARQMFETARDEWAKADLGIFTAAVADFSPEPLGARKFKKSEAAEGFSLRFLPNPDILATLAREKKARQKVVGFAAETGDLKTAVRDKLAAKNADMLAGNLVGVPGSGFAGSTNTVFVADAKGRAEQWPELSKNDVAWRLLDWLLTL